MDKCKKGTRRLSFYVQPSDFQRAVFLYRVFIFLQKKVHLNKEIILSLHVHQGSNYISLFLPPPPSNNLD